MITGFNTNVRYRGRVFHVQTEDSGTKNPHIISHLYFGGTILASEKRDYSEHLESGNLEAEVRSLMETQHKAMLRRLKDAHFDGVIAERLDGASAVPEPDGADTQDRAITSPSLVEVEPHTAPPPESPAPEPPAAPGFGDGIVSEKPLDEVILEYLVEKARGRGARAGRSAKGGSRPAKG